MSLFSKGLGERLKNALPNVDLKALLTSVIQYDYLAATVTLGTEASNHIDATVTLTTAFSALGVTNSQALQRNVLWVLSDTSTGGVAATAPSGNVTVQTGVELSNNASGKSGVASPNSSGVLVLRITESTTKTFYLRIFVDGKHLTTKAVAFA